MELLKVGNNVDKVCVLDGRLVGVKKEEKGSQETMGNADLRDLRELKARPDRMEHQDKTESPGNVEILLMAKMEFKVKN